MYIRQSTSAVITNMLYFRHSKICPNFMEVSWSLYIVMGTRCDCGILFLSFGHVSGSDCGFTKTIIKLQDL